MITIRRRQILALTAAFMASVSGVALAQSAYPSQTVKIIVPFTPGTGMDTIARVVAPRLSERLGQPVVVQNQPGASGNIGADAVAKSTPDGYTVLMGANTMLMASQMYKRIWFTDAGGPSQDGHQIGAGIGQASASPARFDQLWLSGRRDSTPHGHGVVQVGVQHFHAARTLPGLSRVHPRSFGWRTQCGFLAGSHCPRVC